MPTPTPTLLRDARDADLPAITAIYHHAVLHGTGTFELDPPDETEMARRRAEVLGRTLPWLVAERDGTVVGYAYANYFRPRMAYRFCLEDSIYLAPEAQGGGVGSLLLAELIARCEAAGARQMVAVIGDSANHGSIGVHRKLGFRDMGVMQAAGWKFDRWLDVVFLQRELGLGAGGAGMKSKGIAAWLALLLGSVGAHRFYLYGFADRWALAHIPPTLLALVALRGVKNVDSPELTWALPLFGLMVAIGCLSAILIGLTPDERWNARHNPNAPQESRWAPILATIGALLVGGIALMGTIAYTAQRYFEISLGQ